MRCSVIDDGVLFCYRRPVGGHGKLRRANRRKRLQARRRWWKTQWGKELVSSYFGTSDLLVLDPSETP